MSKFNISGYYPGNLKLIVLYIDSLRNNNLFNLYIIEIVKCKKIIENNILNFIYFNILKIGKNSIIKIFKLKYNKTNIIYIKIVFNLIIYFFNNIIIISNDFFVVNNNHSQKDILILIFHYRQMNIDLTK
jgi:hypothetical protein